MAKAVGKHIRGFATELGYLVALDKRWQRVPESRYTRAIERRFIRRALTVAGRLAAAPIRSSDDAFAALHYIGANPGLIALPRIVTRLDDFLLAA